MYAGQLAVGFRPGTFHRVQVVEDVNQLSRVIGAVMIAVMTWRMAIEIIDVRLLAAFLDPWPFLDAVPAI